MLLRSARLCCALAVSHAHRGHADVLLPCMIAHGIRCASSGASSTPPKRPTEEDELELRVLEEQEGAAIARAEADSSDFDEDLTRTAAAAASAAAKARGPAPEGESQRAPWRRARFAATSAAVADVSPDAATPAAARAASEASSAVQYASLLQLKQDLARVRAATTDASARASIAASAAAEGDEDGLEEEDTLFPSSTALPAYGIGVQYCIFCYHGTHILTHENTALLTKFVSERGLILPKRFTKCCAKHQRKLALTIRRARWLNLIPFHKKLHPKLRFTSLQPKAPTEIATQTPQVPTL